GALALRRPRRGRIPRALGGRRGRAPADVDAARDALAPAPRTADSLVGARRDRTAAGDRDDRPRDGAAPRRLRLPPRGGARHRRIPGEVTVGSGGWGAEPPSG